MTGTVVGALFSNFLYLALTCPNSSQCVNTYLLPSLTIWSFICSYNREGPRHGYAHVVAGFTPVVLLLSKYLLLLNSDCHFFFI